MNNSNTLLSPNFMLTVKKEAYENRKAILLGISSLFGICIMIGAFLGYNALGGTSQELLIYNFIFLTIGCVAGSISFSNLKTKESRIATFLLPDTQFDKFIIRWIAVVPVLSCLMIAAFYLGELSRILVFKLSYSSEIVAQSADYCRVVNPLADLFGTVRYGNIVREMNPSAISRTLSGPGLLITNVIISYFFSQSFYIFGSVLWPKLSFIKTTATIWVLQTIFGIIMLLIRDVNFIRIHAEIDDILRGIAALMASVTIILYILSFLRYKRHQVTYKLF